MIYQVMIDEIKVDFVRHPFELVEPAFHESQITYLGKKDIAAMKLHAIETSGNRAKDDDVPEESWKEVRLISQKPAINMIKKTIINAVQEFNDTQINKNT